MESKFGIVIIFLLSLFFCYGEEIQEHDTEKIQTVLPVTTNIQTVLPLQHDLIQQQAETIRELIRTKSQELELDKNENDSLLLKKCQELAKLQIKEEEKTEKPQELRGEELKTDTKPQEVFPNDRIDDHSQPQIISSPYGRTWYYIYHRIFPQTPEVTEKPETTTNAPSTTTAHEHMLTEKMRFILRMPYPKHEALSNFPWEFDRYAYFPKHLQPEYVNVPLPYSPTYHMIRKLIIPSKVPGSFVVEAKP